jgi:hypothetical protein
MNTESVSSNPTVKNTSSCNHADNSSKIEEHQQLVENGGKKSPLCVSIDEMSSVLEKISLSSNTDNEEHSLSSGGFPEEEKDLSTHSAHAENNGEDISLLPNIRDLYEQCSYKKWVKLIPLNKTVAFETYARKEYFTHVADILIDDEKYTSSQKNGVKKRNTMIQFVNKIANDEFAKKTEWIYMLTINGNIVKIGGTRTGLKGRCASYLCGHHIEERGKSGDCSKTNGYIYNTFDFYLRLGCTIRMYAYKLPKTEFTIKIFEKDVNVVAQTYHAYETTFIEDYNKSHGNYPFLCDNCDPDYKKMENDVCA